jgi:hypothetical protein
MPNRKVVVEWSVTDVTDYRSTVEIVGDAAPEVAVIPLVPDLETEDNEVTVTCTNRVITAVTVA